jgi:hypothetical protein
VDDCTKVAYCCDTLEIIIMQIDNNKVFSLILGFGLNSGSFLKIRFYDGFKGPQLSLLSEY